MRLVIALDKLLQSERESGATNKEIATRAGCSQQHINDLLNHKKKKKEKDGTITEKEISLEDVKFRTILNLFPEVRRVLEAHFCRETGGNHAIAGDGGAAAVNGNATVNHAPPAQPPADALAAAVDAALAVAHDAILDDQRMCDACRTIALRHLRSAANRH